MKITLHTVYCLYRCFSVTFLLQYKTTLTNRDKILDKIAWQLTLDIWKMRTYLSLHSIYVPHTHTKDSNCTIFLIKVLVCSLWTRNEYELLEKHWRSKKESSETIKQITQEKEKVIWQYLQYLSD